MSSWFLLLTKYIPLRTNLLKTLNIIQRNPWLRNPNLNSLHARIILPICLALVLILRSGLSNQGFWSIRRSDSSLPLVRFRFIDTNKLPLLIQIRVVNSFHLFFLINIYLFRICRSERLAEDHILLELIDLFVHKFQLFLQVGLIFEFLLKKLMHHVVVIDCRWRPGLLHHFFLTLNLRSDLDLKLCCF